MRAGGEFVYDCECPHCGGAAAMKRSVKNSGLYISCEAGDGCGAIVFKPKGWDEARFQGRYPPMSDAPASTVPEAPSAGGRDFVDEIFGD